MTSVALVTCAAYPRLGPYDHAVLTALRELGVRAIPWIWTEPPPLEVFDAVVVQSCWDSHLDPEGFLAWARRTDRETLLLNPAEMLAWNLHKSYLRILSERGAPVTPTVWRRRGEPLNLDTVARETGWRQLVVKPAISASAKDTFVIDATAAHLVSEADKLSETCELMVQPYLEAFETEGERSYVFFDGVFSHAVRRPPTLADAPRGFNEPAAFEPDGAELRLATEVLDALGARPLYARVDLATGNDGVVRLQELELIEPCLFTALAPGAAQRLAAAILRRIREAGA